MEYINNTRMLSTTCPCEEAMPSFYTCGGGLEQIEYIQEQTERADLLFSNCRNRIPERVMEANKPDCIQGETIYEGELQSPISDIPSRLNSETAVNVQFFVSMMDYFHMTSETEVDVYFYHSDHLGSASWITDNQGVPVQHLQYLPYGEPFVNQRTTSYNERFTFTGKELDQETGYSYFGSRYLDHELTTAWLSVDPMADKYPSLSPYAYCAWNPVKLVDPEGEEIWIKIGSSILENNRIRWTRDGSYYEDGTPYEGGNEFADQTILALNYLYSDEGANIILSKFHGNTEYDIVISETLGITICNVMSCGNDKYGYFPSKKQVIDFNPYIGLAQPTSEDNSQEAYMAPFICLLHEFGHIYNAVSDLKSFNERKATIDEDYDNLEEKTVIQDYEHPVAGRNGMLQRTSHQLDKKGLRLIKTSGSMSSTPINNIEK